MADNDFYNRKRGQARNRGLNEENIKVPSPIHSDVEHVYKLRLIPSSEIEDTTYKSPYNRRSDMHLSMGAVLDILPEIQRDKRNQHPAYGFVDKDGNIEILAGMRRRKAVSLVEDGVFAVLVTTTLDEEERKALARSSDVYQEPTAIDIGFSIIEYKDRVAKSGDNAKVTRDELAEIFGIAQGKVTECVAFANLPSELYSLFPSLAAIEYRFLRDIAKVHKKCEPQLRKAINDAISQGLRVTVNPQDDTDTLKANCKELQNTLLEMVSTKKPAKKPPVTRWSKVKAKKGVKVKVNANGTVALQIDEDKADQKVIDKLYELLK